VFRSIRWKVPAAFGLTLAPRYLQRQTWGGLYAFVPLLFR